MQPTLPVQATRPERIEFACGRQPERCDRRLGVGDLGVGHAGDQKILPDREADIAVAEIAGHGGKRAHLVARHAADRERDADPVEPGLLLRVHADMGEAVEGRARRHRLVRHMDELAAELLLDEAHELLDAEGVEHVFEPGLGAVGAVAVVDEHPHDGVGNRGRLRRLADDAGFAGEILVPSDPADGDAKPHAGLDAEAVLHLDRGEADVVGVLQHRDHARAVEPDIELARDAVERAVVEDVEVPFTRVGPRVEQFLRIDAGGRRAGDVADVVGAGAARAQAEVLDALDHLDRILRLDLAHLQIGAGGDVGIAAGTGIGEVAEAGELPVLEDAVRNAQPAHIGRLGRRAVEQAEEAPAEIVVGLGRLVAGRLGFELLVAVEGMQLALELLLVGELAAALDDAILGGDVRSVGAGDDRRRRRGGCGRPWKPARRLGDLQAGHEAFEIPLLFGFEITGHGVLATTGSRRSLGRNA